ncbi:MAG TPA: type IV secretion system DNA-binding domain-containing protein [Opitutaceae bacterium]
MTGPSERRSAEFSEWDSHLRGFRLWDRAVGIEPPYRPWWKVRAAAKASPDDGRKPTLLSSLLRRAAARLAPTASAAHESDPEPAAEAAERGPVAEFRAQLSEGTRADPAAWLEALRALRTCRGPVAFELVASEGSVAVLLSVDAADEPLAKRTLSAHLPDFAFSPATGYLEAAWGEPGGTASAVVEFGLGRETPVPFVSMKGEPFVGLVSALSTLREGESAVYQVIFVPARVEWAESLVASVTHTDGSPRFANAPELAAGARQKADQPLFAVVVRLAAVAPNIDRSWEVISDAALALGAYGSPHGNELVPLVNDGYPPVDHEQDVLRRQSRRSGMIISAQELAGFAHLPSAELREPKLRPKVRKTRAAPSAAAGGNGVSLGVNSHEGAERTVSLSPEQRARHVHVIGASGTGKSTLLFRMIMQDVERGEGLTLLDPHGDLVDRVLGSIPPERAEDVVLVDPSDEDMIVGFNILGARSDWERNMLASDLVGIFRRLSTSWGDQLNSVLHNAILALLKSERGGTLVDLRRFLLEPAFRAQVVASVRDPNVAYFWRKVFPSLPGGKSVGSVVTRLDTFLSPESIRYMVAQRESRFDVGEAMEGGKIVLARLSQGAIGKDNSHLLGSLLVARIQSEAMARQKQAEGDRRWHWVYIDEFHDFLTPSLADSLTGVRKYRVGFTLAHQEMRQVEREPDVASALLSNAYTRVVFRVGDRDARTMEAGFASFEARDIQNLRNFEAICRVERADCDFSLSVPAPEESDEHDAASRRRSVAEASRARYGVPRTELEEMMARAMPAEDPPEKTKREKSERSEPKAEEPKPPRDEAPLAAAQPVAEPRREAQPVAPASDRVPPVLGGGGEQHRAIKDRIKEAAEALGFLAVEERPVPSGRVDLALSRDGVEIACEITVNNTIDYEVGNVRRSLAAGFAEVAVISTDAAKLRKLEAAVRRSLGEEATKPVAFHSPESFIARLSVPAAEQSPDAPSPARTRGGRRVKRAYSPVTDEEAQAKEADAIAIIAAQMRQKKGPSAPE